MSISTPGGGPERRPSTVSTDKKPAGDKPPAGAKATPAKSAAAKSAADKSAADKSAAKSGGAGSKGPARAGGKGPRKPIAPVKVSGSRNWGPIAMAGGVILLAAGIIGFGVYASIQGSRSWEDKAADISGIVNFRKTQPDLTKPAQHKAGPLTYAEKPPVAGTHNPTWQNCMGDVYDAPIANEHAVHSLEHGAVWVTYKLGMPANQVKKLSDRVNGKEYMLMSPVEGLDKNVSLQAWGYQLKVDTVDDKRIDEFIKDLRSNASMEPGASCSNGITATGTTPRDAAPAAPPS
jgi:hypothetical protein